jgi:PadR family transcriptional regulator PadR
MRPVSERVIPFGIRENGLPPKGTPKNYLMAWLLVMLADQNLHGYEIAKELNQKFAVAADAGTVYRALRLLEREGYISSWWDPKEQGPARRFYALTDAGAAALRTWSQVLDQYRANLEAFFALYEHRHALSAAVKRA